jgi:endonuclease YncB( thermonuclease family)
LGRDLRFSVGRLSPARAIGAILLALLLATCAPPPRVPDGDKLLIGSTHYQLWGIEAPGLHQTCDDDWPAGQEARRALEALTRDRTVVCEPRGLDRYRRVRALCRAGGQDIAASMVGAGLAWADVTQTRAYAGIEREAYVKELGIHGRNCVPPTERELSDRTKAVLKP